MSRQNWRRDSGSTPPVGSSRNTIGGSWRMAQPSASRCRQPPESSPVSVVSRPVQACHLEHNVAARGEPRAATGHRCRRRRRCSDRRSAARRARTAATCSRCAASRASGSRPTSTPPTMAVPEVGRSSPHSIRIVVDLPAPLLPRKPKISPGAHVERQLVDGHEVAEARLRCRTCTRRRRPRDGRPPPSIGFIGPVPWRAVPRRAGRWPARACDRAPPGAARPPRRALRSV